MKSILLLPLLFVATISSNKIEQKEVDTEHSLILISADNEIEQKAQLRAYIDTQINNYHKASSENQSDAEWEFLKNIVNADKFFNHKKEAKKLEKPAEPKKEEAPKKVEGAKAGAQAPLAATKL